MGVLPSAGDLLMEGADGRRGDGQAAPGRVFEQVGVVIHEAGNVHPGQGLSLAVSLAAT